MTGSCGSVSDDSSAEVPAAGDGQEPSPGQRFRGWPYLFGVLALLVGWTATFIALGFFGVPGEVGGWAWAALAYVPTAAFSLILLRNRYPLYKLVVVAVLSSLSAGLVDSHYAVPQFSRLHQVADRTGTPSGWRLSGSDENGNSWCLERCPSVFLRYVTHDSAALAFAAWERRLRRADFEPDRSLRGSCTSPQYHCFYRSGKIVAEIEFPTADRVTGYSGSAGRDLGGTDVWVHYMGVQ